eukprot:gene12291-5874_t
MHTVFTYGTLQTELRANHLLKTSKFLGIGKTKEDFCLTCTETFIPPFVYEYETNERTKVKGELYQVDDDTFKVLDELEGHPTRYYRKEIEVIWNEEILKSWIYFHPKMNSVIIKDGDYKKFFTERVPFGHEFYDIKSRDNEKKE